MVIKKKMGEKRAYISGFVRKRDTNSSQPRVTPEMFYTVYNPKFITSMKAIHFPYS